MQATISKNLEYVITADFCCIKPRQLSISRLLDRDILNLKTGLINLID